MLLHELLGKPPYIPPEKKEKHLSESKIKTSKPAPGKIDTEDALNRVRRQFRRETIKQEPSAEKGKKEKAFIATDKAGGMIGVISAPAPEKAAAKIFHQKFKGENEITSEKPLEIHIRDLAAGTDYHFRIWTEISESIGDIDNERYGKKAVKKLIIKKVS